MQGSLNYICISRGNTILTDYTEETGNFRQVLQEILPEIKPETRDIYQTGDQKFFIRSTSENFIFCILCSRDYQQRIGFTAIDQIMQIFMEKTTLEQRKTALSHSLDKILKNDIKQKYQLFNTPACDKLTTLRQNVDQLKDVLEKDLSLLLQRGEKLEVIVKKSENMKTVSTELHRNAKKVKNHMWWQNKKMLIAIVLIVIVLIWLISSFICGFDYSKC
ncbi:synaptobrevin (macronuclear) [Tetrahymena thermophila SB210]|uniref:Synaptobrevin n=1 Tax=Tetrahymena thermophila (strain SB210) TaxID=312017 RepID=Q23D12_TETTS|nr:synaptobrevin [Tetrahymena thermophila SB210]EAR94620.1 synaptobrevin [Tetrahymena thermophila SB210]|eukprot:XP_001014874.1 synaptobrevin [Tetrahymena thermophila SB210]